MSDGKKGEVVMVNTMKAAYIKEVGAPEAIQFGDLPIPTIANNEVLVKVTVVAVDHVDTYIRSGQYPTAASFPLILGSDMCGVVENVGADVTRFKKGDRVWSNNQGMQGRQGTFAQYVSVEEDLLYPLPKKVDDKEAVAVLQSAATACLGLIRLAKLRPNETIFINGGAGSVGSAVIQLARERGATIIATASTPEKLEWCAKIGAKHTINYKIENVEKRVQEIAPHGVDVYWDTSRQPNLEMAVPLLAKNGRIVLMAGPNAHPTLPVGPFYSKDCAIFGFSLLNATPEELQAYSTIIQMCLEQDKLVGKIAQVLPISETARAHHLLETDKDLWGKLVLTF